MLSPALFLFLLELREDACASVCAKARTFPIQVSSYPALRPLVLVLKSYMREIDLGEVSKGGLSSYGLTYMVLAHLKVRAEEGFCWRASAVAAAAAVVGSLDICCRGGENIKWKTDGLPHSPHLSSNKNSAHGAQCGGNPKIVWLASVV